MSGPDDGTNKFYYNTDTIKNICTIFQLNNKDEFCTSGRQSPYGLQLLLYRIFPPTSTKYEDIMIYLKDFSSSSQPVGSGSQWEKGCHPPEDYSVNYTCIFTLSQSIGAIDVSFDIKTKHVGGYMIIVPSTGINLK
jgi:hypothetical protein